MSTFLELCQAVALESGTIPGDGFPTAVTGQTDRLKRIVGWTAEAWSEIQTNREDWRWMHGEFSGSTISGTQRYDAGALGIATRFEHWIFQGEGRTNNFTSYLTADGVASERVLKFKNYEDFYAEHLVGTPLNGPPQVVSVDYDDNLVFAPVPDDTYTIKGHYQKAPQTLAANGDEPEMPQQYHNLIKWNALNYMAIFDEAVTQNPFWKRESIRILGNLESRQLPKIKFGGPLA